MIYYNGLLVRMERCMSGYETSKGGKRREEERRGTERGTNNLPSLASCYVISCVCRVCVCVWCYPLIQV